jgi:hypothetical protein
VVVGSQRLAADACMLLAAGGGAAEEEEGGEAALAGSRGLARAVLGAAVAATAAVAAAAAAAAAGLGPDAADSALLPSEATPAGLECRELLLLLLLLPGGIVGLPHPGAAEPTMARVARGAELGRLLEVLLGVLKADLEVAWRGCVITVWPVWDVDDGTDDAP